jgi:uncharacterized membrane protein
MVRMIGFRAIEVMSFLNQLLFPLTLFAAISCGLIGGVFFAFSNFVMKALARIPEAQGMKAMQMINVTVLNPLFLTIFMGAAAACVVLAIYSVTRWQMPDAACLLIGSLLYFGGNFVVTVTCNVPRNNALAQVSVSDPESINVWRTYLSEWTRWNHVRTVTAIAASVSFTIALCQLRSVS